MEDVEELREIVDGMTHCAVTPDAPEWYLNPVFKTVLGAEDGVLESLCSDHPLFSADHFLRVLKDDAPPSLDFFQKIGCPAKLYIGSGTSASQGVFSRLIDYDNENSSNLPDLHYLPSAAHVPRARVRLVAVEAVLAFVFFAGRPCQMDVLWEDLLPWRREQATWEPLCTHTAFLEKPPGDVEMSSEQLEAYNAARIVRAKQNMAKNSKAAEDREKAVSLKAYRARKLKEKLA
ncbi:hypothetical protein GQ607_000062 [Colletotrichum asianum]|uniref:Uncharacterized protein n=1 Tax=Colletotrichum asianum TaxID=702518 RepID=A0A8H3WTQ4_9PEZI|nr:hypothetical protein GQ607_000062 [Colletotrichum asianum]